MRARGIVRALGAAPIAVACAVVCGVPAVALALSGAPSHKTAGAVVARVANSRTPLRRHKHATRHKLAARRTLAVSRFAVQPLATSVEAGHSVTLQGRLLPAAAGRVVRLSGHGADAGGCSPAAVRVGPAASRSATRSRGRAAPPCGSVSRVGTALAPRLRAPAQSSASSRPSRRGITTPATRLAGSTPTTALQTRRCRAGPCDVRVRRPVGRRDGR